MMPSWGEDAPFTPAQAQEALEAAMDSLTYTWGVQAHGDERVGKITFDVDTQAAWNSAMAMFALVLYDLQNQGADVDAALRRVREMIREAGQRDD